MKNQQRLIVGEPANPEGLYQKAGVLMARAWSINAGEDRTQPVAALRQAAAMKGRRDDHLAERIQAVREAALAWGVGPGDAARLALDGPLKHGAIAHILKGAIGTLPANAKTAGGHDRLVEIAGIGLTIAEKFSAEQSVTISGELYASKLKKDMLADLPDETEIGEGGRSVGSLKVEVEERYNYLMQCRQRNAEVTALLETASDDVMVSYFSRFMQHGELEAQSWLLSQAGKAK